MKGSDLFAFYFMLKVVGSPFAGRNPFQARPPP